MGNPAPQPADRVEDASGPIATDGPVPDLEPTGGAIDLVETDHDDLLGELARAMHAAAEAQHGRINAELERRRVEQVEAIAARASSEVEHLKTGSEADISAIDAWAKAETEKIKLERLRRIDARRERLVNQLERQETIKARAVGAIEAAIDTHRNEIEMFFGRMDREADPAAIALVASTVPPFPPLAEIAEEAERGAASEFANLDKEAGLATAADDLGLETAISESRLMAVMDPNASRGAGGDAAQPWESEPRAVIVAAGSGVADETDPSAGGRATLLRTTASIRPMADRQDPGSGEEGTAELLG